MDRTELRDEIAIKVLPVLMEDDISLGPEKLAEDAYKIADKFLESNARNRELEYDCRSENPDLAELKYIIKEIESDVCSIKKSNIKGAMPKQLLKHAQNASKDALGKINKIVKQIKETD